MFTDPDFLYDAGIFGDSAIKKVPKCIFFHCARAKRLYFYFLSKIWRYRRVFRPWFFIRRKTFSDFATSKGYIAYFFIAHAQNALFLLPVKNLTSPSCLQTPISYRCRNFDDSAINMGQIAYLLLRMRKPSLFLLPVKTMTSPSCFPTPNSNIMQEFWLFDHK